jgi:glycosyltransferase involved in cell wall biosynthesis
MRVLVVPKWYPWPDRPVFGIFCQEQARALARHHDVVVLASDATPDPPFRAYALTDNLEDGVRTLRVRYRRPRVRPFALGFQIAGLLAALTRLRRGGWVPDIVHAHVYSAGLAAIPLARRARAPLVLSEHFTGFERGLVTGYERRLARIAFRTADLVAPVSHELARRLETGFGARPDRIAVVPNVVDTDTFHPESHGRPGAAHDPPRLLSVGTLTAKKGHRDLLDALAQSPLRERRPSLQLVGAGDQRPALEAQSAAAGLDVTFLGERPKAEVAALMRDADLFVLPSHHENLPTVLIEAQASGLPAVASAVGGVPEVIDSATGRLVAPRDPQALGRAIAEMLEARQQFDPVRIAEAARDRYGYEAFAARWSELYARLVRTMNRPARSTPDNPSSATA